MSANVDQDYGSYVIPSNPVGKSVVLYIDEESWMCVSSLFVTVSNVLEDGGFMVVIILNLG